MNTLWKTGRRLPARFAPETRFEINPVPSAPFRGVLETELERLKERLLRNTLEATTNTELIVPLRRAATEAAATAWLTPFPTLVFPALFEEKAGLARLQVQRQERIRERSQFLMAEAA